MTSTPTNPKAVMTLPLDGVFAVKSSGNGASGARGARLGFACGPRGGRARGTEISSRIWATTNGSTEENGWTTCRNGGSVFLVLLQWLIDATIIDLTTQQGGREKSRAEASVGGRRWRSRRCSDQRRGFGSLGLQLDATWSVSGGTKSRIIM